MPAALTDQDFQTLSLANLLVSDEAVKGRLAEILAAHAELVDAQHQLAATRAGNEAALNAAARAVEKANAVAAQNETRARELDERERTMAEVSDALNAEKEAFEKVRREVGDNHAFREAKILGREKYLHAALDECAAKLKGIDDLLAAAKAKHDRYSAMMEDLQAVFMRHAEDADA